MDLQFYWQLSSLLIIVIYALLVFRNVDPLLATFVCVVLGFIFNRATPIEIGQTLESALSSFLALVGLIIMLGRGLGEILNESRVSHCLVHKVVYGIGVNTQFKVKLGVIISSLLIVGVLGTLAGGLAILAPILRPIAANVGLTRPSLAVLMQAAGEEALIIGPFAPPVVALLGISGISYVTMLIYASLPIAFITLLVSWFMASRLQVEFKTELYLVEDNAPQFIPTKRQVLTCVYFSLAFVTCVIYGLLFKAKTSYVVFVMLFLAISTGLIAGLKLSHIFNLLVDGMKKNFHLFFIFLLLDPFLNLVQKAGGFHALLELFTQFNHGGKVLLSILVGLTGAFGMPAASAAVIKMLYAIFAPSALKLQLATTTLAFSMLLATRITNFAIPGANMFAAMGFAESQNIKAMIKNGLVVASVQIAFLIIYSILWS